MKEAHISGSHAWDAKKLKIYANYLDHPQALIAVKGGANQSKGARDPALDAAQPFLLVQIPC